MFNSTAGRSLGASVLSATSVRDSERHTNRGTEHDQQKQQNDINRLLSAEDVRPLINGVLSISIGSVRIFKSEKEGSLDPFNTYIRVHIQDFSKRTKVSPCVRGIARFDQKKHFPVQILRNRRHPSNLLRLQLVSFARVHENHRELGTVAFHLHDVVQSRGFVGSFDLFNVNDIIGEIDLNVAFNYGILGYGYSEQLKDREGFRAPDDFVKTCLYPRIEPPSMRMERGRSVLVPKAVCHPGYIPFGVRVILTPARDNAHHMNWSAALRERFPNLTGTMHDFVYHRTALQQLSSRHAKLQVLRDVLAAPSRRTEAIREAPLTQTREARPFEKYLRAAAGLLSYGDTPDEMFADVDHDPDDDTEAPHERTPYP